MSPSGCFREYFVHKFRAMLGKNRVIFPGEKVPAGGTRTGDPGVAPGPVTIPAVPTGAAGSVRGPGLQRHGPAGAGGEIRGLGGFREGHGLATPVTPHLTPLLCQGLSREAAKRLRFVPGLVYVEGEGTLLLLRVQLPVPNPFPAPCPTAHSQAIPCPSACSLSCCQLPAALPVPCPTPSTVSPALCQGQGAATQPSKAMAPRAGPLAPGMGPGM